MAEKLDGVLSSKAPPIREQFVVLPNTYQIGPLFTQLQNQIGIQDQTKFTQECLVILNNHTAFLASNDQRAMIVVTPQTTAQVLRHECFHYFLKVYVTQREREKILEKFFRKFGADIGKYAQYMVGRDRMWVFEEVLVRIANGDWFLDSQTGKRQFTATERGKTRYEKTIQPWIYKELSRF